MGIYDWRVHIKQFDKVKTLTLLPVSSFRVAMEEAGNLRATIDQDLTDDELVLEYPDLDVPIEVWLSSSCCLVRALTHCVRASMGRQRLRKTYVANG